METSNPRPVRESWPRTIGLVLLCLVIAAGVIAAAVWSAGSERREIDRLSPEQRRQVFTRTWENFRELCQEPGKALQEHCRMQGRFLLNFGDCDRECHAAIRRVLSTGSR